MSNDKWWNQPKSHAEKFSDDNKRRYVREVESAVNSIGGEQGARIANAVTESIAKSQGRKIAEAQRQKDFKDLQEKELRARGDVNPFGFFTEKPYGRPGPTATDRLDIKRMKEQAPPPPKPKDWSRNGTADRPSGAEPQVNDHSQDRGRDR